VVLWLGLWHCGILASMSKAKRRPLRLNEVYQLDMNCSHEGYATKLWAE